MVVSSCRHRSHPRVCRSTFYPVLTLLPPKCYWLLLSLCVVLRRRSPLGTIGVEPTVSSCSPCCPHPEAPLHLCRHESCRRQPSGPSVAIVAGATSATTPSSPSTLDSTSVPCARRVSHHPCQTLDPIRVDPIHSKTSH